MDPTLYNAAVDGNIAGGNFILADHMKRDEENGYQVTPNGNTVLHVAALYGHSHFVGEVLKVTPGMLCLQNKEKETALHIAANEGHAKVVHMLLNKAVNDKKTVMRMTDENGDTALHKAVWSQHLDIVKLLVKSEDPEFELPANHARKTPLYLAAESGFLDALTVILESCKKPNYATGPFNRTPLHVAVIQEHADSARLLLQWNKSLCEELDLWGWNSLHYAVKQGLIKVVSEMLEWKKSLAYLPAGSENDWTTPFHIASSEGDENMMVELLKHCPDCWEMLSSSGQNALHVAILNNQDKVMETLFNFGSLVDKPDNDGNTPLHLLAASGKYVPENLRNHPKAKKMLLNKENQTPLDIALSGTGTETTHKEDLVVGSWSIGPLGQCDLKVIRKETCIPKPNDKTETSGTIQQLEDDQDKAERDLIMKYLSAAQIHLVVATLVMTVTFAAGFTLPGGFDSSDGLNKGTAILIKQAAFRAFVVTDVLAFACSASAIFIFYAMADVSIDTRTRIAIIRRYYLAAVNLLVLSVASVIVAFITGVYATISHSLGLAITVCIISCLPFFLLLWAIVFYIIKI